MTYETFLSKAGVAEDRSCTDNTSSRCARCFPCAMAALTCAGQTVLFESISDIPDISGVAEGQACADDINSRC